MRNSIRQRQRGVALIIVLAFVVLLTGLTVAYFSQSTADRQIAHGSFNQSNADQIASSGVAVILGDLRQEIIDGSTAISISPTPSPGPSVVYVPKQNAYMLPLRSGTPSPTPTSGAADPLPNLIRRSVAGEPAQWPDPTSGPARGSRASAVNSTTQPSLNGRSITLARWNKHYLLPRYNPSSPAIDATPPSPLISANPNPPVATGFTPPDWVFITAAAGATPSPPLSSVIGRYAYAIYDEGGLLNVNVVGYPYVTTGSPPISPAPISAPSPPFGVNAYPSASPSLTQTTYTARQLARKDSPAFADLSVVPAAATTFFPPDQINTLVGWRNFATLQPNGTFPSFSFSKANATSYYNYVESNTAGFLSVGTTTWSGRTDQVFPNRQSLLAFRTSTQFSQNLLQYFSTFGLDLNQPSVLRDSTRPRITSGNGGNDAVTADDSVNPSFLQVRATSGFTRHTFDAQGSPTPSPAPTAAIGEPLVVKRFPLNRLTWVTYKGPSSTRTTSDPDIQALLQAGITTGYISAGTAQNIYDSFGLSWITVSGTSKWVYSHTGTVPITTLPSTVTPIRTLSQVANLNREPDFVELLKAAIDAGAIAKGATRYLMGTIGTVNYPTPLPSVTPIAGADRAEDYQFRRDISSDYAILQVAANIIDQFDCDGYPTRIAFNFGLSAPQEAYGVENLPYIYRLRNTVIKATYPSPSPLNGNTSSGAVPAETPKPASPAYSGTGMLVSLLVPEVWNPHDQSANSAAGTPRPMLLRFVADSTDPANLAAVESVPTPSPTPLPFSQFGVCSRANISPTTTAFAAYNPSSGVPLYSNNTAVLSPTSPTFNSTFNYALKPITLTAATTALQFTDANAALFREPTMLNRPSIPAGSNLVAASTNALFTTFHVDFPAFAGFNTTTGAITIANNVSPYLQYLGVYLGASPLRWVGRGTDTKDYLLSGYRPVYMSSPTPTPAASPLPSPTWLNDRLDRGFTYRLQYQDASGNWITYDQKVSQVLAPNGPGIDYNSTPSADVAGIFNGSVVAPNTGMGYSGCIDPRTSRFGMWGPDNTQAPPPFPSPSPTIWIDQANNVLPTQRATAASGLYVYNTSMLPHATGWFPSTSAAGDWGTGSATYRFIPGMFSQNDPKATPTPGPASPALNAPEYYTDADSVVRRAMGAHYATGPAPPPSPAPTPSPGLPLATSINASATPIPQSQSRPIVLNRPFKSVADLGYVFSGIPWRNLSMFTPESGFAKLLDVFCVNETADLGGMEAGRVNLNTRQVPVIQAILTGAYRDELSASSSSISMADASNLATVLVNRTTSTAAGKGPLSDVSELVGKWVSPVVVGAASPAPLSTPAPGSTPNPVDGARSYDGFSADISAVFGANPLPPATPSASDNNIARLREASVRALANCGQMRVWNLMIDVIAQSGRYGPNETDLNKFIVEGEQRYWVHVAIDRFTGQVINKQIEVVNE